MNYPRLWWKTVLEIFILCYVVITMQCVDDESNVERSVNMIYYYWINNLCGYLSYSYTCESDKYVMMTHACLMSHWWWKVKGKWFWLDDNEIDLIWL